MAKANRIAKMHISDPLSLINTFLSKVGMGKQVFDETNCIPLTFDNIVISLNKDADRNLLAITSVIGKVSENSNEEISSEDYYKFLESNLASAITGSGAVGISCETNLLIYGNAISLIDLTQNAFEAFLERSVNVIEDWHNITKQAQAFIPSRSNEINKETEGAIRI